MLMAVVPNQQIVHEEDPKAFMFVHETYQALGVSFVPMQDILTLQEKERSKQDGKNT